MSVSTVFIVITVQMSIVKVVHFSLVGGIKLSGLLPYFETGSNPIFKSRSQRKGAYIYVSQLAKTPVSLHIH